MHATRPSAAILAGLAFSFASGVSLSAFAQVQDFDMQQVRVTDPYLQNLFDVDVDYLLSLDADRLMAGFASVSQGSESTAGLYGGWENTLIRGHTLGHYLTALAQAHKETLGVDNTLNQQIDSVLTHMMDSLKTYQDRTGGYLFATLESHFDRLEAGSSDIWVPWYTMHKILAGIVDVYKFTGNETALEVASRLGDWIYDRASGWDSGMRSRVLGIEYGGMNDCLYELYKYTNKQNHLDAAHIFDEDSFFTPISQGQDTLNGRHANTHIPKALGALNRYRTLGESESFYFDTAEQFWEIVVGSHTYVTGGNSELEHFHEPRQLDRYRDNTNNETCNSHNMLKLTRELFKVTTDVRYADFYERGLINEILSAINPETGMTTYFKPMGTGYHKVFGSATNSFWCCTGTGMENYTKLNDSIYFHDDGDLYVNLFISSTLDWTERSLSLTQTASVPLDPTVSFTIDSAPAEEVGIKFRNPDWLAADGLALLAVNGQPVCTQAIDGYYEVSRVWSAGDTIEYTVPADVTVSRLPDNQNAVAFMYGPLVLSAGMGTANMVSEPQWASEKAAPPPTPVKETIAIQSGTIEDWIANINDNVVQTPGQLEFKLQNTDEDNNLTFTPQYLRYQDRYGIYFRLEGDQGTNPGPGTPPDEVWTDCEGATAGTGGTGGTGGVGGTGGAGETGGAGGTSGAGGTGGVAGTTTGVGGGETGGSAAGGTTTGGRATGGVSGTVTGGAGTGGSSLDGTGAASTTTGAVSGTATGGVGTGLVPGAGGSSAGDSPAASGSSDDEGGCSCRAAGGRVASPLSLVVGLGLLLLGSRRRRRS